MTDTFEFTLSNPLAEEQWDMITDVDFDRTDRITFHTKHGKEVEFAKVIRCKDCQYWMKNPYRESSVFGLCFKHKDIAIATDETDWCSWAERRKDETN